METEAKMIIRKTRKKNLKATIFLKVLEKIVFVFGAISQDFNFK